MAQGLDKIENLMCAKGISSVSELNPEKPREINSVDVEMHL